MPKQINPESIPEPKGPESLEEAELNEDCERVISYYLKKPDHTIKSTDTAQMREDLEMSVNEMVRVNKELVKDTGILEVVGKSPGAKRDFSFRLSLEKVEENRQKAYVTLYLQGEIGRLELNRA